MWAPGQDRIPSKANVSQYSVVEQGPWIWAWIGNPAKADDSALPETPWFSADEWATVSGMEPLPARYGLLSHGFEVFDPERSHIAVGAGCLATQPIGLFTTMAPALMNFVPPPDRKFPRKANAAIH